MTRLNHRCFFVLIMIAWLFPRISAADADMSHSSRIFSLRQCIEKAIDNDPDVNYAQDWKGVGHMMKKQALQDLFFPTIGIETVDGPKLSYLGNLLTEDNIFYTQATLTKPLYKGGQLKNSYRLSTNEIKKAAYDYQQTIAAVAVETVEDYYNFLSAQETRRYLSELRVHAEETVNLMTTKFEAGAAIKPDLLDAKNKMHKIQYELIKATGETKRAMAALNERIGNDPSEDIEVLRSLPLQPLDIP